MLARIFEFIMRVYLFAGVAGFGVLAVLIAYEGVTDAFRSCYTVLPDGSVSEELDSFHLRTWVLGLFIPSYRRTAMRGILFLLLCALLSSLAGFVAVAIGQGLMG